MSAGLVRTLPGAPPAPAEHRVDVRFMRDRPFADQRHRFMQAAAEVGQAVFRLGRDDGIDLARDDAVALQTPKHLDQPSPKPPDLLITLSRCTYRG